MAHSISVFTEDFAHVPIKHIFIITLEIPSVMGVGWHFACITRHKKHLINLIYQKQRILAPNGGFQSMVVPPNQSSWLTFGLFNNHGWPKPRSPAAIDPRHRASWDFWSPPTGLYVHPLGSSRAFPRRRYQLYLKQGEYLPVELRCHQMWCVLKKIIIVGDLSH
jgi:hypothetical protein